MHATRCHADGERPTLRLIHGGVSTHVAGPAAPPDPAFRPPPERPPGGARRGGPHPVGAGVRRPVRLTRRGRLLRTVAVLLLAAGLGAAVAGSGSAEPPLRQVEVRQGDTLWSITDKYAATGDPVATIERIRRLNHLSGYTIYPGQELAVPVDG